MRIKPFSKALLVTSSLVVASAAYAQGPSEEPQVRAEADETGIIVTANRRAESLQDVAMSVDVATGDDLQKLNIFDVKDVQQLAPGLELTNTTGRNNTTTLRGVSFDPDQGTGPAVRVYYNEIPTDAQTAYTAIYDIQQIEVLRGPQGLLRGLSAPAGAITIATRRPGFDGPSGYVQATGTSRAGYNVQGGATLPFSDTLSLRVAMLADGNRVNHVRNVNRGGDRSYGRTESARATLGWKPSDNFSAYLTYQYLTADTTQYAQVAGSGNAPTYQLLPFLGGFLIPNAGLRSGPPLAPSDYGAVAEGAFRIRNDTHLVNLATNWDIGWATLSFVGAHQYSVLDTERDGDPANAVPGYISTSHVRVPYKVDTAELRLASNNDDGFGWGVGAFYTKQTGTTVVRQQGDSFFFPTSIAETQAIFGAPPYLPVDTLVVVPVDTSTWSFNANLRYKAGGFTIEGGLRYSIIKSNQTTQLTVTSPGNSFVGIPAFTTGPTEIIPANLQRFTNRPLTGGLTLGYEITPALNIYAAYGHSFRGGSTSVAGPAGVSADLVRTNPEKTDSFEVGLKGSLADRRINFSVAGFYQKLDNFLTRFTGIYYNAPFAQPPTGFFDFNYNADAKIKGVEGSIDGRVGDNWDFGVSASYAHARFSNALVPCNDYAGTGVPNQTGAPAVTGGGNVSYCATNGRLAEIPDFSLSANSEVRMPIGSVTPFLRGLFTYRPGFYSERVNYNYRSRELLNLYLGVRSEESGWELNVFAKNVFDQRRITGTSLGNAIQPTASLPYDSGYRMINVTAPREFGATFSYRW